MSSYSSYYKRRSRAELSELVKNANFVFDTNIFLGLFEEKDGVAKSWLEVIEKLVKDKRVFIPHQVGFEYHQKVHSIVNRVGKVMPDRLESALEKRFSEPAQFDLTEYLFLSEEAKADIQRQIEMSSRQSEDAMAEMRKLIKSESKSLVARCEEIQARVFKIFEITLGGPYSSVQLAGLIEQARARFEQRIPPGYMDDSKTSNKYGDIIAWFQILDFAKGSTRPIICVTHDRKEDWFYTDHSGKIIGPRAELVEEMKSLAGKDCHIYVGSSFLQAVKPIVSVDIDKDAFAMPKERSIESNEKTALELFRIVSAIPALQKLGQTVFDPSMYLLIKDPTVLKPADSELHIYKSEEPNRKEDHGESD